MRVYGTSSCSAIRWLGTTGWMDHSHSFAIDTYTHLQRSRGPFKRVSSSLLLSVAQAYIHRGRPAEYTHYFRTRETFHVPSGHTYPVRYEASMTVPVACTTCNRLSCRFDASAELETNGAYTSRHGKACVRSLSYAISHHAPMERVGLGETN